MKILILIDTLNFGGAEKQAVMDAANLSKMNIDVYMLYFVNGPLLSEIEKNIKDHHITSKSYFGRITSLVKYIKKKQINIIHAHMFKAEIIAACACKIMSIPVIFNEHGLGLWRKSYHKLIYRIAALSADEIICASAATSLIRIKKEKIRKNKISVVYNSFTPLLPKFYISQNHPVKALQPFGPINKNQLIIGFVGRFDAVKRLYIFIYLAQKFRKDNVSFILVGDGKERLLLEKIILSKKLNDKFFFPGFVHNPSEYYALFDLFFLPSKRESLSLALIEAGSYGVPAIAFDVGGNNEIISNGKTGYIIPDTELNKLTQKIKYLISNYAVRKKFGETAKKYIQNKFSPAIRYKRLIAIYTKSKNTNLN